VTVLIKRKVTSYYGTLWVGILKSGSLSLCGIKVRRNIIPQSNSMQQGNSWQTHNRWAGQDISPFMGPKGSLPCSHEPVTEPYPEPLEFIPYPYCLLISIVILSSHLHLRLPNGHFPSGFPTKNS